MKAGALNKVLLAHSVCSKPGKFSAAYLPRIELISNLPVDPWRA